MSLHLQKNNLKKKLIKKYDLNNDDINDKVIIAT